VYVEREAIAICAPATCCVAQRMHGKKYSCIPKFYTGTELSGLHPARKNSRRHAVKNLLDYLTMLLHLQILYSVE
jgi:hypothetical protein